MRNICFCVCVCFKIWSIFILLISVIYKAFRQALPDKRYPLLAFYDVHMKTLFAVSIIFKFIVNSSGTKSRVDRAPTHCTPPLIPQKNPITALLSTLYCRGYYKNNDKWSLCRVNEQLGPSSYAVESTMSVTHRHIDQIIAPLPKNRFSLMRVSDARDQTVAEATDTTDNSTDSIASSAPSSVHENDEQSSYDSDTTVVTVESSPEQSAICTDKLDGTKESPD